MKKIKILVIDDEKEQRQAIIKFFSKPIYELFEASNDEAGRRIFVIEHPDVVVVDLHLKRARGEEVARFIKRDPNIETKVICLGNNPDLERLAKAAGCDAFLEKPFHLLKLEELIKSLFVQTFTCR